MTTNGPGVAGPLLEVGPFAALLAVGHAYPDLAHLATGFVLGDFVTRILGALLAAHRRPVQLVAAATSGAILAWWLHGHPFPEDAEARGMAALAFLAALAFKTLPEVYAHLHRDPHDDG